MVCLAIGLTRKMGCPYDIPLLKLWVCHQILHEIYLLLIWNLLQYPTSLLPLLPKSPKHLRKVYCYCWSLLLTAPKRWSIFILLWFLFDKFLYITYRLFLSMDLLPSHIAYLLLLYFIIFIIIRENLLILIFNYLFINSFFTILIFSRSFWMLYSLDIFVEGLSFTFMDCFFCLAGQIAFCYFFHQIGPIFELLSHLSDGVCVTGFHYLLGCCALCMGCCCFSCLPSDYFFRFCVRTMHWGPNVRVFGRCRTFMLHLISI